MDRNEYEFVINECREISKKKNSDYSDAPLKQHGTFGILVRISDKYWRLMTLMEKPQLSKVKNEKIEDTLMDMINYCIYAVMSERKKL